MLLDNIFKNAIKHNFENGKISIVTEPNAIIISNTGDEPTVPTEQFFTRFYSKNTNESLGLGLSIIKKIIDYYHFKITYIYINGFHQITIHF
jgi:signal transduction histidine kinase